MSHYISFPALGWTFNVSPTIVEFTLFGHQFSLNWYGLLIALGFLLAVIYALKRVKQFDIDPDRMIDVVLVAAIFAFIGARLYYVLFSENRAEYFDDPLSILQVWKGGLGIYGGIIFAFIAGLVMCKIRKVNTPAMFDLASLGFLIGQAVGRWGNFFNQEAFGGNTTLPWGMTGDIIQSGPAGTSGYTLSDPVHPTFLYESLWCLAGFILLHILSKKAYKFKGQIFSLYLVWYGVGRFMIESLRTDSLYFGAMKVSQLVAVLAVIGGAVLFFVLRAHANTLPKNLFPAPAPDGGEIPEGADNAEGDGSADGDAEAGGEGETSGGEEAEDGAAPASRSEDEEKKEEKGEEAEDAGAPESEGSPAAADADGAAEEADETPAAQPDEDGRKKGQAGE